MWAVAGLVALAACGPNIVGSRYVKSQDAHAGQAALLTVDATENLELAGTRLDIPAGVLATDAKLTVELGLNSILGAELAAGPVAVFGPISTTFNGEATLVLPVTGAGSTDDVGIVAQDANGTSYEIDPNRVALNPSRTLATFKIKRLGTFQPRRRIACSSDSQCATGLRCTNGRCQAPSGTVTDGGPATCGMTCPSGSVCDPLRNVCTQTNGCTSNADCPTNLACIAGSCQLPNSNACGAMGCPSGQVCVNFACVVAGSDGGTTNPQACNTDSDCGMGDVCVMGVCRAACVPHAESCNNIDDDCDGIIDEGCSNSDGGISCGGFAGLACPSGLSCVDDPTDMCDPTTANDCMGICVRGGMDGGVDGGIDGGPADGGMDAGIECGGFAGLACPSGLTCVDNPNDMCDPLTANDCIGMCVVDADGGVDAGADAGVDGGAQDGGMANVCRTNLDCATGQSCINGVCQ
ncbi:MAG: hypothetical protein U0228_22565 [Myxococcaceae bacterium]